MESGRITCHPHLSADQIKALPRHIVADKTEQPNAQQTCGICLVDYRAGDQVIDLPCKHFFHESCVVPWLSIKDKCPYCNYKLCSPQEP
ncbi:hypothetical protein EV178_001265 [Coemansia sp. RSA 1646]|nr:hypothetical protein EV178_001265 [Coemansia sp. RSA 1646]